MGSDKPVKALNLDLNQQQSFIRFFNSMPEKPTTSVRFFNRINFYSVHGDDAVFTSKELGLPLKLMGDKPELSYVTLNKAQFEAFARELLLIKQYRLEVYTKSQNKLQNDFKLEYKGSPGNLEQFEEILFENANIDFTNVLLVLKIFQNKNVAVCSINMTDAKFEVCEMGDNESYTEIEGIVARIGPKECIIPAGDTPDLVSLKKVLERNGILVATVKKSDFPTQPNQVLLQDLNRLLFFHEDQQRNAAIYVETKMEQAMSCLQAGIKFLNLTSDERNFNLFKLTTLETNRFLRLDIATLYSLNILPKPQSQEEQSLKKVPAKLSSLKGILDYCVTFPGRRLLEQWLKQPLIDHNLINDRLDIVETLVKDSEVRKRLAKDSLTKMADLMPLIKKISSKRAKLQDCFMVYQTVYHLPVMVNLLRDTMNKCVKSVLVTPLEEIVSDMQNYQSMIEETLDFELIQHGEFLIKSSYDEDLQELQRKKRKVMEIMQNELDRVADDLDLEAGKTIKLEFAEHLGYFFRVTQKNENALGKRKGYKIVSSLKGGIRFVSDKLEVLSEKYNKIHKEYEETQQGIVDKLKEIAGGYSEVLRNLNNLIAMIDVFNSLATAAISARIPYARPKLHPTGSGVLKLTKVRHACLEAQERISYIPNDVNFDENDTLFYIITGPNMCGKSTYMRSIGMCVLMAHVGSFVPCETAQIPIVDQILVRIGANDCEAKGLSTFMMEMVETSAILKCATKNSLVLIDELGRGTSTYDGFGIAWAVAEHLVNEIKCFSLFATHFHEICNLADNNGTVKNVHVTAAVTDKTITPLYQIRDGVCDKSYGIHCARVVGFPEDVIEDAIQFQKQLEHDNGLKYIVDYEPPLKKKVISEGDELIKSALERLESMKLENKSREEYVEIMKKFKEELLASNNLFIKGLLED